MKGNSTSQIRNTLSFSEYFKEFILFCLKYMTVKNIWEKKFKKFHYPYYFSKLCANLFFSVIGFCFVLHSNCNVCVYM